MAKRKRRNSPRSTESDVRNCARRAFSGCRLEKVVNTSFATEEDSLGGTLNMVSTSFFHAGNRNTSLSFSFRRIVNRSWKLRAERLRRPPR